MLFGIWSLVFIWQILATLAPVYNDMDDRIALHSGRRVITI